MTKFGEGCKNATPPNSLIVDRNDTFQRGVGCYAVLIAGLFQPECRKEICPLQNKRNVKNDKKM